jgi:hypothetical protein
LPDKAECFFFFATLKEFSVSPSFSFGKVPPSDAVTASCLLLSVLFVEEEGKLGLTIVVVAISA